MHVNIIMGGEKVKNNMQKKLTVITLLLIFALVSIGSVSAESSDNITADNSSAPTNEDIINDTSTKLPDPEVWRGGVLIYSTTTIQDAMDHSISGDTIKLEDGQTFYENLVIDKDLTFEVMNGGTATIDGSGTDRVIHILPGITSYFYNITFQNGHAPDGSLLSPDGENGGGIWNEGTLYLINCIVKDNQAGNGGTITYGGIGGSGGGIYSTGTLELTDTKVYNNRAGDGSDGTALTHSDGFRGGHGGGIYSTGALTINNSELYNNHAGNGGNGVVLGEGGNGGNGGAIVTTGTLTMSNTQIYENYAGNAGTGGINMIIGGTGGAGGNGGAIYNTGNANVEDSEIYTNNAGDGGTGASASDGNLLHPTGYNGHHGGPGGNGGAIYNQGTLSLTETEIYSNKAGNGGTGGAAGDGLDRSLSSLGVGGPGGVGGIGGAGGNGGAIYNTGYDTLTVTDCTITQNIAGNGGNGGNGGIGGNARSSNVYPGYNGNGLNGGAGGAGGAGGNAGAIYYKNGTLIVESDNFLNNIIGNNGLGGAGGPRGIGTGSGSGTAGTTGLPGSPGTGGAFYAANNTALNFNRILSNGLVDVAAATDAILHAENNWWGSNDNPSSRVSEGVVYSPWIMLQIFANPGTIVPHGTSNIIADLTWNTLDGVTPNVQPDGNHIPDYIPVTFATTMDSINPKNTVTAGGTASSTFTGTILGTATVSAQVDNQIKSTNVNVEKADSLITVGSVSGVYLGSVDLSATLVDEFGNVISGVLVDFLVDGVLVGSGTTDGSGLATVTYTPITENPSSNPHTITAEFAGNDNYNPTSGTNDLTVAKATTEIMVDNVIGNKGKTVNLIATLKDQYGNLLAGRTVNFLVNGVNAGSAVTDINGVANKSYFINLNGGTYNIQVDFIGDDYYIASTAIGTLKVSQAELYVKTWASKNNPSVGESITITFKVGNRGPDAAENVVFVLKIPKGMEFVKANVDQGTFTYDKATRTITWNIGNVPVGDPYLYLVVKVLESGKYILQPILSTDTYDPNLNSNIEAVIINAQSGSDNGDRVPMQNTGMPIWLLLMAIMVVCGGIIIPFKK